MIRPFFFLNSRHGHISADFLRMIRITGAILLFHRDFLDSLIGMLLQGIFFNYRRTREKNYLS